MILMIKMIINIIIRWMALDPITFEKSHQANPCKNRFTLVDSANKSFY